MFIEKLNSKTWLEEKVVKVAINKVNKIDQKVGYPEKVKLQSAVLIPSCLC